MGILSQLTKELEELINDAERLPYEEDSTEKIAWRYCRLLWQDKLQLELVTQLTKIATHMEVRTGLMRDVLLDEKKYDSEADVFLSPKEE